MRSLLLFSALLLLLAIKGDGHFPLPATTPEIAFQLYVLGLTLLFGMGLVCLVRRTRHPSTNDAADAADASKAPPLRAAAVIAGSFLVLDCGVLFLEARRYASFGYAWRPLAAMLACLVPAAACAWLARRRGPAPAAGLMILAAAAHGALCLYACASFPLAAARSDMMPLLVQAGRELLAGHDPYTLYHLTPGPGIPLTYLPGLLLAYLPAALLKLDPRLVGLVYTYAAVWLLVRRAGAGAGAFLSPFLVNPYLIYRHDVYLAPFWLLLAISWAALARPRPASLAASCGTLAMTSPLLVIPAYAMAACGFKRYGRRAMLRSLLPAAAACVAILGPFLLPDLASFARGTVGHWQDALNLESLGITYWLLVFLSSPIVHILQAMIVIAILSISLRPRALRETASCGPPPSPFPPPDSPAPRPPAIDPKNPLSSRSVFAAAALALFAFSALNTVIWTYFYLLVLFLAMLAHLDPANSETAGKRLNQGEENQPTPRRASPDLAERGIVT